MRSRTATSITQSQAAFVVSPAPPVHLDASMPTVACCTNNPLSEELLSVSYCTQREDHEAPWSSATALLHTAVFAACMAAIAKLPRLSFHFQKTVWRVRPNSANATAALIRGFGGGSGFGGTGFQRDANAVPRTEGDGSQRHYRMPRDQTDTVVLRDRGENER